MIRLHFVENGEDAFATMDEKTPFDAVMKEVQSLLGKGVKMVGLETPDLKMFFDGSNLGMKSITGKFKTTQRIV